MFDGKIIGLDGDIINAIATKPPGWLVHRSVVVLTARHGRALRKVYTTVTDLHGLNLGTVTGYVWVNAIKSIGGATLHAYPNDISVFQDLSAGRISVAFLDPLLIIYYQKQVPGCRVESEYLTPPTGDQIKQHPAYQYSRPHMTGYYLPKQEPKLAAAVSAQIRAIYADGQMAVLIKKWGGNPQRSS